MLSHNKSVIILSIFFSLLFVLFFYSSAKIESEKKYQSFDPFQYSSSPEEQGINSEILAGMLEKIKEENLKIRSVIIIKNGRLILESYVHPYNRSVTHDIKSVSKSVISALLGIALKEKIIENVNQKVTDFLPEYFPAEADSLKKEITLAHLLSMSSGLDLDENGPIMSGIMAEDDLIKATFNRAMITKPGKNFKYCTLLTHTLSLVLTKSCEMGLLEFGNKYLFGLLGIKQIHWEKGPHGYYFGGDKLWLTPQAMAKFGYLYLNKGNWENNQIVPEEWVRESTKDYFEEFSDSIYSGYGYSWWLKEEESYHARGFGGQIISIYPNLDMVVVFTGADNSAWEKITSDYIIPAVNKTGNLPPSPIAEKKVKKLIRELEFPEPQSVPALPEMSKKISGKKYILKKNNLDFSELTLFFNEPSLCSLAIKYGETTLNLAVGLDDIYRVTEKVKWGMKPNNNILALKGTWLNDTKFFIDFQEVGEPFYFDTLLEFDEDSLSASFTWQPFKWKFLLEGAAE